MLQMSNKPLPAIVEMGAADLRNYLLTAGLPLHLQHENCHMRGKSAAPITIFATQPCCSSFNPAVPSTAAAAPAGLLQAAEIAWQQDDASLYAQDNFALTAAMELHARFTNAYLGGKSVAMLPEGYRFYDSGTFPKPLADSSWKFNMEKQLWSEYWTINGSYTGYDLTDGDKYVLGSGFLPTGW